MLLEIEISLTLAAANTTNVGFRRREDSFTLENVELLALAAFVNNPLR